MPSLHETLQQLASHSAQITHLATLNSPPAGPFTRAQLRLPYTDPLSGRVYRDNLIPDLIRDAEDSERRLFTFVGEDDGPRGAKVVEKKEGGIVTPLRAGNGKPKEEDVEILLGTALKLVDDYRPMPRARAHIQALLTSYREQQEQIAALQRQIAQASDPLFVAQPAPEEPATDVVPDETLSPDEVIQREEAAIKELEAEVADLRRQKRAQTQGQVQGDNQAVESDAFPSSSSSLLAHKTPPPTHASLLDTSPPPAMTPSPPRGPMKTPVRNVALQRARAANTPLAHFSPTRPTAASGRKPGLGAPAPRMSIFGTRKRMPVRASTPPPMEVVEPIETNVAPAPLVASEHLIEEPTPRFASPEAPAHQEIPEETEDEGDATVRLDAPPEPETPAAVTEEVVPSEPERSIPPEPELATESSASIQSPLAESAAAKIWTQLGDLMKQGDNVPTDQSTDIEATIRNLTRITNSELPPPPSPSSSSTISSLASLTSTFAAPAKSAPLTSLSILTAHLCLLLLRAGPSMTLPLNEVKATLAATAKARGWGDGVELGTKTIYGAVGKKVIRIDRRGGGPGGRLVFNL